jgi:hypothetical protein
MVPIVTLDDLLVVWPFVKKGFLHIKKRDKSAGSQTHHQLFNAIRFGLPTPERTNAVMLHVAVEGERTVRGFMVTCPLIDPFLSNTPVGILVRYLYADFPMVQQFLPALKNLCRQYGGDVIEFQSGRLGWLRNFGRMKRLGWDIYHYTYRLTLD